MTLQTTTIKQRRKKRNENRVARAKAKPSRRHLQQSKRSKAMTFVT